MPKTCFASDQIWYWDENFHYDSWFSNFVSEKRKGKKEKEKDWWGWGGKGEYKNQEQSNGREKGDQLQDLTVDGEEPTKQMCGSFVFLSPHASHSCHGPQMSPHMPIDWLIHHHTILYWLMHHHSSYERERYIYHITLHYIQREREREETGTVPFSLS